MNGVPASEPLALQAAARLAESLRAPGAFALDALSGALIGPPGGLAPHPAARGTLLAFARDNRGGGATLLDISLSGPGVPATPSACRMLDLDEERRAIIVVPIDGGARARAAAELAYGAALSPSETGAPLVRVLWQCDADGAVTHVGDRLKQLMGPQAGALVGKRWRDLIGDVILDPTGGLEAALARRETASGVELLWSRDRGAGPITVHWSGLPVHDGARRFRGFRGFLLAPDDDAPAEAGPETRIDEALAPVAGAEAIAPSRPVVAPSVAVAEAPPQAMASATPLMPHLSTAERNAFREIARVLGVRQPDDPPRPARNAALEAKADAVAHEGSPEPSEPLTASIADATPATALAASPAAAIDETARTAGAPEEGLTSVDGSTEVPAIGGFAAAAGEPPTTAGVAAAPTPLAEEPTPDSPAGEPEAPGPSALAAPVAATIPGRPLEALDPVQIHAREMLDRLPVGVLVNRGNRVLYANRTLLDLLDYPSLAAIEAQGGASALFRGRAPLTDRDGPAGPVLLGVRDGESVAVDARLQGVVWDGAPATLVTFRRSIDVEVSQKLKASELDLRARETELRETRAVLDTATDGVVVVDEDGRILSMNRTAEALFGYEQNEVAGESITILFAPESHALAADYFEGLKSGGVRSVMNDGRDFVGRVRQGGRIPLFATFGQISDKPDRKFCAVLRDLSPWKKTERDLVEARRQAENASAQKSDFLAKISHEIRTPLNAIIGFAEVMMEERFGQVGNERYKDYLRDIHMSGGHVISLVNDLLDLSKIEAGKLELTFASVNANEIVRGAVNLMQPQSQRARVVVRSALAGKLPAIVADERALKQIVLNLLSNAVKFTDSGGQVIISTTLTDLGEVAIRIRDTGIGMTEKELAEAMEPFRQLATSRRAGGTGLGLPLTKALVEANRANLKLSSVKNEGTLAEVVFPPTRVLAE